MLLRDPKKWAGGRGTRHNPGVVRSPVRKEGGGGGGGSGDMANLGSTDVLGGQRGRTLQCVVYGVMMRDVLITTQGGGEWMNLYGGISVSLWEIADSFLGIANNNF